MPRADRDPQGASVPVDWLEAVLREGFILKRVTPQEEHDRVLAKFHDLGEPAAAELVAAALARGEFTGHAEPDFPALAAAVRRAVEERMPKSGDDEIPWDWSAGYSAALADVRARLAP